MSPVRIPALRAGRTAASIASSGPAPANIRGISCSGATPRIAPKPRSKSASASVPVSSPTSRSRLAGSPRKRSRTVSSERPSRSQKPAKDANTSVVITPPQSTRSPRFATVTSGGPSLEPVSRDPEGALGQLDHTLPEGLQPRVVGGAHHRALVVALHEYRRLPHRQRHVPVQ